MEDLEKNIPLELTITLNKFNSQLSSFKKQILMEAKSNDIKQVNSTVQQIKITYSLKNTDFYFNIFFIKNLDKISWAYYPYNNISTKPHAVAPTDSSSSIYLSISSALLNWKKLIENFYTFKNPLRFFQDDDFIKFYSDEILEEIPITEDEKKFPLSSAKQVKALNVLNLQADFLTNEINNIEDKSSEQYKELEFARNLTDKIKEELPRSTAEEVKRNWSMSLAYIKKWCGEKFIAILKMDKELNYDLSRSLGSFIGGVIGIPKIDS